MNHVELREELINRVGWKQPTDSTLTIDTDNQTTESGRYFQDEHAFVTIDNIYHTMHQKNADDAEFNAYLKQLKERAIILVISDVFEVSEIQDNILTGRENIFDDAISKRMAIVVGETIFTSTRSNVKEIINKEQQQKLFFEINGSEGNPNFPNYVGLKSRYGNVISEIKSRLGQVKALDTFTFGLPNYDNDEDYLIL